MTAIEDHDIDLWLEAFAASVRARDVEAGRALFAADAVGFGTVAATYGDRDQLIDEQWSDVWPRTEEFSFTAAEHRWTGAGFCAVAATWSSVGTDAAGRRTRTGRATLVLRREGDVLVAVHSHFSMTPGTPA